MRSFIYLVIIAAAGYVAYTYYVEKTGGKTDASAAPDVAATEPAATPKVSVPAAPVFKSRIPFSDANSDGKHLAKPGVFYVLERASIEHENGIAAIVPGDEVKLLMRKDNGVVKVTTGKHEFEVKESQITNDLDVAREAERKYVLTHPPARQ